MVEGKAVKVSIVFIAAVLLAFVLREFQVFLRPFVMAIIVTFLLMPLMRLSKKIRIPFGVSILVLVVVFLISVSLAGILITEDIAGIRESFPSKLNLDIAKIDVGGLEFDLKKIIHPERIFEIVRNIFTQLIQSIGSLFSELFFVMIFTLFLIPSLRILITNIESGLNTAKKKKFRSALSETERNIRNYLYTKSIISLGTALVSAVILLFFQADFIVILAFIIFALNFIPNIGSVIATGLVVIFYALTVGMGVNLVVLTSMLILTQIVFGNIIEPKIAGDQLKLNPVVILLSLFFWYWVWGIGGMILAVPVTSVIKIILGHFDSTKRMTKFLS